MLSGGMSCVGKTRTNPRLHCRITPWVTNMGYQNSFLVAAFAALAVIAGFLVYTLFGRGLRKKSTQRYLKYVKQMEEDGLTH